MEDRIKQFLNDYAFCVHLNANDTFAYACADSERIAVEDLDKLLEVERQYGHHGVTAFMSAKRNCEPLNELITAEYKAARASLDGYKFS
jgi:hypothetical protein